MLWLDEHLMFTSLVCIHDVDHHVNHVHIYARSNENNGFSCDKNMNVDEKCIE